MYDDDFFEHHGIKGMKWGVRRTAAQLGNRFKKENVKSLSDEELTTRVKRLNLEKQYVDLVNQEKARNRNAIARGANEVGKMLETAGKLALQNQLNKSVNSVISVSSVMATAAIQEKKK